MKKSISAVSWVSDVNVKFAYQYYTVFKHSEGFNMVRKNASSKFGVFSPLHINFIRIVVSICKIRFKFEMDLKTSLILILLMNAQSFTVLPFFFLFFYPLLSVGSFGFFCRLKFTNLLPIT